MTRRAWYRGAVAACAAAGLLVTATACSDGDGDGSAEQPQIDASSINWWDIQPSDGDVGVLFNGYATEFNEQNPDGPQVVLTPIQNGPYNGVLRTAMQSGNPPDLFQSWGGAELRDQVDAGLVRDITDDLADVIERISPSALGPYTIDGRVYGIPWNFAMVGFWYNTELFAEAGIDAPPETWSDFLDAVEQLKAADITPIALGGASQWPGHFYWSYLAMRTAGLDAFATAVDNGQLDDPGFVRAGELLAELVALEPFQPGFLGVEYEQEDGQAATMGRGEAAMELMGQWAVGGQIDWSGAEGEARQDIIDNRAFFQFPAVEGGNGALTEIFGGGDGVALGSNAPDATLDLVRLIFDNYSDIAATPGTIPTVAGMSDEVTNPALLPVADALEASTGFQLYLDRDWPGGVGNEVNEATAALIAGEMAPEEVVSSINEVWEREG